MPKRTRSPILLSATVLPALVAVSCSLPAQGLTKSDSLRSKRALNEVLQPSEAELSKRITPVVRAVQATSDSVVSVLIVGGRNRFTGENTVLGQGSGVIIDDKGLALTNWHVVARAMEGRQPVQVRMKNGKRYRAKVLSTSPENDLALMQLELPRGETVQPVTMGDSSSLMIGETVIAIGNPKGHRNTVTVGVLSAEARTIKVRTPDGRVREYKGLLQTDAAINQGNSGGALLDITGKLIGINNAVSVNSENIGFAIPVNTVRRVFHQVLLSSENLTTLFLGMKVQEQSGKVILADVSKAGPAYRSGLRTGDELLRINDKQVENTLDYARSLLGVPADEPLSIQVRRRGEKLTRRPVPMSNAAWTVARRIGLEFRLRPYESNRRLVQTATRELYRELNQNPTSYLRAVLEVTRVHSRSPAANLGIQKGDVILGIVDRWRDFFGPRSELKTYASISELHDSLHVLSHRSRDPKYTVWILRDGEVLDGHLEIPRL